MIPKNHTTKIFRPVPMLIALAVTLSLLPAQSAVAEDKDAKDHPGYVEGSQFVDLIDDDGDLIEISLDRKLLRLFSGRALKRMDSEIGAILSNLVAMNAVIGEISENREAAKAELDAIRKKVERDGWDRFIRVRENGEEYAAYIHINDKDDEIVDGLLVIGFRNNEEDEGGKEELLFVNIAGVIDMERIALLGERFKVPGLDDLPPMSEVERQRAEDAKKDREKTEDKLARKELE